jgi:hypothetical protein
MGIRYRNLNFTEKKNTRLVFAFILLNLFIFAATFESFIGIPKIVKYIFSITVIFLFIRFFKESEKIKFYSFPVFVFTYLFLFVSIFLLLRSIRSEVLYIQLFFADNLFFMPYFLPLLFLFSRYNLSFFKIFLRFSYYLALMAIVVELFIIATTLDASFYLYNVIGIATVSLMPALLLIVSHLFDKKKYARATFLFFILLIFITAMLGRRGETLESIFFLIWAIFIRLKSNNFNAFKRIKIITISILVISIATFFIVQNVDNIYLFERGFSQESFDESRGDTVDNFLTQFGTLPNDYLIGRGLDGEFRKFSSGDNQISSSIEIGYFNILLKGGFSYLIPMVLLFIFSFYKGFFKSKNDLIKGLAGIILWQIIYMASFGMAIYNTNYLFLWIAVAACLDPRIRNITNEELKNYLNK